MELDGDRTGNTNVSRLAVVGAGGGGWEGRHDGGCATFPFEKSTKPTHGHRLITGRWVKISVPVPVGIPIPMMFTTDSEDGHLDTFAQSPCYGYIELHVRY